MTISPIENEAVSSQPTQDQLARLRAIHASFKSADGEERSPLERLERLRQNLQRSDFWVPKEDLLFLNTEALRHPAKLFRHLLPGVTGYPTPSKEYWALEPEEGSVLYISLKTGRWFFREEYPSEGTGSVIEFWRNVREVFFIDAVRELTDFLIRQEKTPPVTRKSEPSLLSLKKQITEVIRKTGKKTLRGSNKSIYRIVTKEIGNDCRYLSSPDLFRELLRIWAGARDKQGFEVVERVFKSEDLKRNRITEKPVFTLKLTEFDFLD